MNATPRDAKPTNVEARAEHIRRLVETWPPLNAHQRSVIAAAFATPHASHQHERAS